MATVPIISGRRGMREAKIVSGIAVSAANPA